MRQTTMTHRYAVLTVSALALLAGCGSTTAAEPRTPSPDTHGSTLTVQTQINPGKHGSMFIEGALPEIRLVTSGGTELKPSKDHASPAVFADLPPGDYRLRAVLRPCDGNCGNLDGPLSPCGKAAHVDGDLTFAVTWRVGDDCHVTQS
jgi:hypothetical protein